MADGTGDRVLITGVSGYIASHVAKRLLDAGYRVRGTVRSLDKGQRIVDALAADGADVSQLELVEANLGADAGWKAAVQDCRYVQHIASPFPLDAPRDREALVPEARAGAMRVVEHALAVGAERVVMTSSTVAMWGRAGRGDHLVVGEDDWTDPDWKPLTAYPVSKTRAERAVWDYLEAQGLQDRLTVVCPAFVLGPDPYDNGGASLDVIQRMFAGEFPGVPRLTYPIVDVRDCASVHVSAMTTEAASGRRLIAASDALSFPDIAELLRKAYPTARKLPKRTLPNFMVKLVGLLDESVKGIVMDVGVRLEADAGYTNRMLNIVPRPAHEAVLAAAEAVQA